MNKSNVLIKSKGFFRLTKSMSREVANLQEYIANLPTNVIRNIYRHPASCLAIFRLVKSKFSYE